MLFSELLDAVLEEELQPQMQSLLKQKAQMMEAEKGARLEPLHDYIEQNLKRYQMLASQLADDRNPDWTRLNQLFYTLIRKKG